MSGVLIAVLLPAVAALVMVVVRDIITDRVAARLGLAVSLLSALALVLAWLNRGDKAYAGEVDVLWVRSLGMHWHLGMDGISFPLLLMTSLLTALVCWALTDDPPAGENSTPALVALVMVVLAAALGVFAALDLLLFFVFFELALIPMWFVIARWGDPHDPRGRRRAATRFLVFTVAGSAFMLVGFVTVAASAGTLQIPELAARDVPLAGGWALFAACAIAVGLAVKTPVWPLHIWLPDAHASAPTVGSVLLAAVFLKLGTYGLLRVLASVLPDPTATLAPWLAILGVIGIVYAALACLRQDDLKRLIAYSSVGHMGFVVLAVATMSEIGVAAAVFASVAHGVITGLLFFNAGALKRRFGSAELSVIGRGLYARTPALAVVLAFAAIASLGLPGLAGFWGEMMALRGTYDAATSSGGVLAAGLAGTLLVVALVGVLLTSAYVLRVLRTTMQGVPTPSPDDLDLSGSERGIATVLVVGVLLLGLAPGLLVGIIEPSIPAILGGAP
ncbi:NADH-quinone oxidoreductase subunit M [Mumia flava]|uniref:NADH-quinone oxidoreductase subunit M n=1 Tax=Mumia flava TaxID=1348852 RepID=A0A0B2BI10_9ACTN|nr:NADH-quinone oxidoreductase subunit M [Mumia flava]PJJ58274.1 NADH-quinone oxidoreductase subunit M [Mumia flava]